MVQHNSIDHSGLLSVSYASNSTDVSTAAAGASTLVSRADHVHGGSSAAVDAIWDAAGDLAVGTGANAAARLAIGAANTALVSNGTTASWGPGAATSYSPALTAATTNPTLGSGSAVAGHWMQIGKLVIAWGSVTFGSSGTNAGSGEYRVSLPVTSVSTSPRIMGSVICYDSSASRFFNAFAYYSSTTVFRIAIGETAGNLTASETLPMAWGANDIIIFSLMYEAA